MGGPMGCTHSDCAHCNGTIKRLNNRIQSLIKAAKCRDCPDRGWYYDGSGEPEQCEFCYREPNSFFNAVNSK